jgi:hypothetical protein
MRYEMRPGTELRPRPGTTACAKSNRPAGDVESISCDFDVAWEANTRRELPECQTSRRPGCCIVLCVLRTTEPGKTRPIARNGILAVCEECRQSASAPKWPRRNLNLPLAAGPRVRHIRAHGAVAEWLKAAVC